MNKIICSTLTLLLTLITFTTAQAEIDASKLSKKKQTKLGLYMDAKQAYDHMNSDGNNTLFVDIRTRSEINFLGMPTVADANIPYMKMSEWYAWDEEKHNFKLDVNSEFAEVLEERLEAKGLSKDSTVILMCRSGKRSAKAADLLAGLGYKKVYSVIDGYEGGKVKVGELKGMRLKDGWKNAKLPWTYNLDKNKMYTASN